MNRQIKFRGRDAYGKYRCGDLWQRNDGTLISDGEVWHRVDPKTVAQLISTGRDGYEIYEGDPIKLADGWRCTATFRHFGAIVDGDATLIN